MASQPTESSATGPVRALMGTYGDQSICGHRSRTFRRSPLAPAQPCGEMTRPSYPLDTSGLTVVAYRDGSTALTRHRSRPNGRKSLAYWAFARRTSFAVTVFT